jgi:dTMP kinase
MAERGIYWMLEGPGGGGKTSNAEWMVRHLVSLGRKAEETREPGGVYASEKLRDFIFALKSGESANADQLAALFMASRYFLAIELIEPKLQAGIDVINVRGFPSTAIYQGLDGASMNYIEKMASIAMGDTRPDAILLFDVSADTTIARKAKDDGGDPFDRQGYGKLRAISEGYKSLAALRYGGVDWHVVDAEQSIASVREQVKTIVCRVLEKIRR